MPAATLTQRMAMLGIAQEGAPILASATRPFDLPAEGDDARRVLVQLVSVMTLVIRAHTFAKGMGLSANQIGVARSAAVVRDRDGTVITLLNPAIVTESPATDERYEGCLSFFDVRGAVPRPLSIEVRHQGLGGEPVVTAFHNGLARLVAHEVDHLDGLLYRTRMRPGVVPIPVAEYRGTGGTWDYPTDPRPAQDTMGS